MAKKKESKQKTRLRSSYMFPNLHDSVESEVRDDIGAARFHDEDTDRNCNNLYETHVIARFICLNRTCSTSTSSGKVAIRIRGYPGNAYNAVVFNQRCESCHALGKMRLNKDTYVERVSYRLKRWGGVEMERPPHSSRGTPPHKCELCEGCKAGYCLQGRMLKSLQKLSLEYLCSLLAWKLAGDVVLYDGLPPSHSQPCSFTWPYHPLSQS